MKSRIIDLFCGAGGAAMGYHQAGFEVVGVDINPQPRYPFEFHQADALTFPLDGFDAIHASPPCQRFSKAVKKRHRVNHADLIAETRDRLVANGRPYVIENVPTAPLIDPIRLCGSGFGLAVKRHRLFESNVPLMSTGCAHWAFPRIYPSAKSRVTLLRWVSPSGGYQKGVPLEIVQAVMGIDWMTMGELTEAIPPAYTAFIGSQLLEASAKEAKVNRMERDEGYGEA